MKAKATFMKREIKQHIHTGYGDPENRSRKTSWRKYDVETHTPKRRLSGIVVKRNAKTVIMQIAGGTLVKRHIVRHTVKFAEA